MFQEKTHYNTMRHVIQLLEMQVHDLRDNNTSMALMLKSHIVGDLKLEVAR